MSDFRTASEKKPNSRTPLDDRSKALRRVVLSTLQSARRGHLGSAFSIVEMVRVLYDDILKYDPKNPSWAERDRFILSKGHGCLALYAILAEKGFFPKEELSRFCKSEGILGGHPERGKVPGVEATTGSLGHGFSIGVGMALAARIEGKRFRVFVISSDGEANEGSLWEGALAAAKHKLSHFSVFIDYNKYTTYGTTYEVLDLEPLADKWRSFGFAVAEVDGHDVQALNAIASRLPLDPQKPSAVICHTVKGKGIAAIENNMKWHHVTKISDEEMKSLIEGLELYT
jgi:transketolase